jgi:hypothetical protein
MTAAVGVMSLLEDWHLGCGHTGGCHTSTNQTSEAADAASQAHAATAAAAATAVAA